MENGGVASSVLFFYLSALKDIPAAIALFQPSAIQSQKMMLLLSVDCKTQTNKTFLVSLKAFSAKGVTHDLPIEQRARAETGQQKVIHN